MALCCTFKLYEPVECAEADRIILVVGFERHAEETSVRYDHGASGRDVTSAQSLHLAVRHVDVEVGEDDVIAVRPLQAPASPW